LRQKTLFEHKIKRVKNNNEANKEGGKNADNNKKSKT